MSNKNRQILGSLAMDLKRVALGYHNGSTKTAQRFLEEAIKRENEISGENLKPYLIECLRKVSRLSQEKDGSRIAENALMYSTLFQNAAISK